MLLLFADKREFQPLVNRISTSENLDFPFFSVVQWQSGTKQHQILATGSRKNKITDRLDALPAEWLQGSILLAGTAGDLSGELDPPVPFLPTELTLRKSEESIELADTPISHLKSSLESHQIKFNTGRLLTVDSPVFQQSARRQAADKFNAQAVDMEAFKVYHSLAESGFADNFAVLKVISDSTETESLAAAKQRQPTALRELVHLLIKIYR